MATLAIAGVGAAVGWGVGGTALAMSIGWSVGSALGSYLFAPDGPDVEGPRLNDLDVQSAAYGRPKPETWGTMRQAGQIIAADQIKETKHRESTGGKGGGGGSQTTYTYSLTWALAFGEGPIVGIRRIWANGNLIYAANPNASPEMITASVSSVTVYTGAEDQEPDPTLEALEGAGNVPAYRGTPYAVFKDMELEDYGNSAPHIEAEIVVSGDVAPVTELWKHPGGNDAKFSNYPGGMLVEQGIVKVFHNRWTYREMCRGDKKRLHHYNQSGTWLGEELWNPPIQLVSDVMGVLGGGVTDCNDLPNLSSGQLYILGKLGSRWVWANNLTDEVNVGKVTIPSSEADPRRAAVTSSGRYLCYRNPNNASRITIRDENLDVVLDDHDLGFSIGYFGIEDGFLWLYQGSTFAVTLYALDFHTGETQLVGTTPSHGGATSATRNFGVVDNGTLYIAGQTGTYSLAGVTRIPLIEKSDTVLSQVVSGLCASAGLEPSDYDASQLTDNVPGYSRTKSMTARRAIEPLQQVYRFDALESDWMLRFVPRGQTPVVEVPYEDLAAHPYGQDRPEAIGETRTQEPELPREVVMRYLDVDADYEDNAQRAQRIVTGSEHKESIDVPIAESADHMAQSAEILLYTAWLERTKHRVLLPPSYEYLDPSDVVTTTEADGTTHQLRISRVRNGNILELEGIADSPSVYTSDATGSAIDLDPSVIGQRGPTRVALLDIPLLRDADNNAGFYIAANGWLEGWTGSVLYVSSDGGETYGTVRPVLTGSPMGAVTNTLADGPVAVFDRANTLNVQLPLAELESVTDEALMDGRRNACAVGTPDGWEILQFRDAVLEADGSYTLSHLIRGRRGTEWMTGQHGTGERFVLLTPGALERAPFSIDNIGATRLYKAVTTGKPIVGAAEIEFANNAVGLKPYAPAHLKAQPQGGGNYSVSWIRRTRIGGEWRDNVNATLGEASELYRVRVLDGATEISSVETSNTSRTVAASPGNTIAVAQISETVGPGHEAETTV